MDIVEAVDEEMGDDYAKSVSYTHLDVYKRQHQTMQSSEKYRKNLKLLQYDICLLYTSYWYYMTYSNEKGDLIIYNQHDADYVIQMAFDKQKDRKEEVSVCGVTGKYFTHEDKGVIIYEVNGVTYTIQGAVSKQELIKMLENRERIG